MIVTAQAQHRSALTSVDATVAQLRNAVLTESRSFKDSHQFSGCIYDEQGRLMRSAQRSSLRTAWKPIDPEFIAPDSIVPERLAGRSLYLGHLPNHYGHFLLEALGRFWAINEVPKPDHIVFHPFVAGNVPKISTQIQACLAIFGLESDNIRVIGASTRCDELYIPTQLVTINVSMDRRMTQVYRHISDHVGQRHQLGWRARIAKLLGRRLPDKLYLSRRKLNLAQRRAVDHEPAIEQWFVSQGFSVIHPQEVPFERQVALYRQARAIAGYSGSALHNIVFSPPGTLLIELGDYRRQGAVRNQLCCNALSGANGHYVDTVDSDDRDTLEAGVFLTLESLIRQGSLG